MLFSSLEELGFEIWELEEVSDGFSGFELFSEESEGLVSEEVGLSDETDELLDEDELGFEELLPELLEIGLDDELLLELVVSEEVEFEVVVSEEDVGLELVGLELVEPEEEELSEEDSFLSSEEEE